MSKETVIRTYFQMWLKRDFTGWQTLFSPQITYMECYGPIYQGYSEMQAWFDHSLAVQTVTEWAISAINTSVNPAIVRWHFTATTEKTSSFAGVSLIWFDHQRMAKIEEYAMKDQHQRPFQQS